MKKNYLEAYEISIAFLEFQILWSSTRTSHMSIFIAGGRSAHSHLLFSDLYS